MDVIFDNPTHHLDFFVSSTNVTPEYWKNIKTAGLSTSGFTRRVAAEQAEEAQHREALILSEFTPEKYLLTHCTACCGVQTEQSPDWYIKPEFTEDPHNQYINNNGDGWTNEMLFVCYKTFIGGHNYYNHIQDPAQSKGRIIDAVCRKVVLANEGKEDEIFTYYVDLLVATNSKHADIIKRIENGELTTLSMGCLTAYTTCSQCGHKAITEEELCSHIRYNKRSYFTDENGQQRLVAELCGSLDGSDPESVTFIEISWVEIPAFAGAVTRNTLAVTPPKESALIKRKTSSKKLPAGIVDTEYILQNLSARKMTRAMAAKLFVETNSAPDKNRLVKIALMVWAAEGDEPPAEKPKESEEETKINKLLEAPSKEEAPKEDTPEETSAPSEEAPEEAPAPKEPPPPPEKPWDDTAPITEVVDHATETLMSMVRKNLDKKIEKEMGEYGIKDKKGLPTPFSRALFNEPLNASIIKIMPSKELHRIGIELRGNKEAFNLKEIQKIAKILSNDCTPPATLPNGNIIFNINIKPKFNNRVSNIIEKASAQSLAKSFRKLGYKTVIL